MMEKQTSFVSAVQEALTSPDVADLGVDPFDFVVDDLVEGTVFYEVPIVKELKSAYRANVHFRDKQLLKKTLVYFQSYADGSLSLEDADIYCFCLANEAFATEEVERVLDILDYTTRIKQSQWIGKLYRKLVDQEIRLTDFHELTGAVRRMYVDDVDVVKDIAMGTITDSDDCERYKLSCLEVSRPRDQASHAGRWHVLESRERAHAGHRQGQVCDRQRTGSCNYLDMTLLEGRSCRWAIGVDRKRIDVLRTPIKEVLLCL